MLVRKLRSLVAITAILFVAAPMIAQDSEDDVQMVRFPEDVLALEYVGQVNNGSPLCTTSSCQFGYFSYVAGLPAFDTSSNPNFTFYTHAVTKRITNNGTLVIVDRTGTTNVCQATSPPSFSNPDSFQCVTPIQVSTLQQQVILDTATHEFSVVNVNTITDTSTFLLDGQEYQLGKVGDRFRTLLRGITNSVPPPGFYMAGYAVGVGKN